MQDYWLIIVSAMSLTIVSILLIRISKKKKAH